MAIYRFAPVLPCRRCTPLHPVRWNAALVVFPENFGKENFRDVFKMVESSPKCMDNVFIHDAAEYHYKYYHNYRGMDLRNEAKILTSTAIANVISHSPQCIWIVYAHISEHELNYTTEWLTSLNYDVLHRINKIGASAVLYVRDSH